MTDLARQAFTTQNFDLAADIYERNLLEHGPKLEYYIGLANSSARNKQFRKAFAAYSVAFRLDKIEPVKLDHLVEALTEAMSEEMAKTNSVVADCSDVFSCGLCKGLWRDPVTVTCGHTFCRSCLMKQTARSCKVCGVSHIHLNYASLKTNVLLSSTTKRWFPSEVEAASLKHEGNKCFGKGQYEKAIEIYSKALEYVPDDHLVVSNRSYAYTSLEQYQDALQDAEKTVSLRPDWPKGYYRKAQALSGLHQEEEAAFAYLQCLALDPEVKSARTSLAKSLHQLLSPKPAASPTTAKHAELQCLLNSTLFSKCVKGKSHLSMTFPLEKWQQMGLALREDLDPAVGFTPKIIPEHFLMSLEKAIKVELPSRSVPCSPRSSPLLPMKHRSHSLRNIAMRERIQSRKRMSNGELTPGAYEDDPSSSEDESLQQENSKKLSVREVAKELLTKEEFECSLCYRLLYIPVTTPCGHVFCKQCLDRCLDHNSQCPQCRSSLAEHLAERRHIATEAVEQAIQMYFPEDLQERKIQHEEDMEELIKMGKDNQHEIPVFVCTLSYPGVSCPLHIFEPRYRLMVRQCMESGTRQFGMCACFGENEDDYADYGCMLEIRDVQYFPDGRSVVDTVGGRRFKVLQRSRREGYHTAKVEFITDMVPEDEAVLEELQKLHDEVLNEATAWFESLPQMARVRITQHFGNFPTLEPNMLQLESGPAWSWWLVAVMPLGSRTQLSIIAMTSLKERLQALKRVFIYIKRKNSSGQVA